MSSSKFEIPNIESLPMVCAEPRLSFDEMAELLKVLAHPTRLAILNALKPGPKCVTDVCELCEVSQPNVSQHLSILRREGVVKFYEDGKSRCYFIVRPVQIATIIVALNAQEESYKPDCCNH